METHGSPALPVKKKSPTPKDIIYQRFRGNARYEVEEVPESTTNGCPGLAIPQKVTCLFRCSLQLPEVFVVSEICKRKKDAEQSAAQKAIEKLGISPPTNNSTAQDPWNELASRLTYFFSNEFLTTVQPIQPLTGHFKASLLREGHLYGSVPVSVISVFDKKLINLCKDINPEVESNPWLVMSLVLKAAASLTSYVFTPDNQLSLQRLNPYPPEVVEALVNQQPKSPESTWIRAIRVPYLVEKTVEPVTLNVSDNGYYLDVIAQELGVTDASKVLISRTIGKASSEIRLYSCAPKSYLLDVSSELDKTETAELAESLNSRASYFSGQAIYGDAILVCIGYIWDSTKLFYEDISLRTYYRLLINKIPTGVYKLSREAILAAELPVTFTTRSNWKGPYPRDILFAICHQYRLSEPVFSTVNIPLKMSELCGSYKKLKVTESGEQETNGGGPAVGAMGSVGTFKCEVKIFSKTQELIMKCTPKESFKKQNDAIQDAALKILLWLNTFLKKLDLSIENLTASGDELAIQIYPQYFSKEFVLCPSVYDHRQSTRTRASRLLDSDCSSQLNVMSEDTVLSINNGHCSGVSSSAGSLVCISYNICLLADGDCIKELLESSEKFEFEIGVRAVVPHLEAVVSQMSVGQSTCYTTELPPQELIMAAAGDSERTLSLSSSRSCSLEYSITLLSVTEPLEERMEQALFSPPLSKQRVEFALQHIKESCAASLVDFGCGAGSLLDSLLAYPTSLEKVVGVDISQRSLARAAKTLHSKLTTNSEAAAASNGIKSAVLYDGSITIFDSRLYGFDIGTCLEVIEHMEEDQACLFGDVVLSSFCPKILIVSTPNYEYNVILQKSSLQSQEEDPEEKKQTQTCKFRNHDHKFEWTREQFSDWASNLAERHNYSVEFSGVGGVDGVEPGFASQIAVFRRGDNDCSKNLNAADHYEVIWEWSSSNSSRSL